MTDTPGGHWVPLDEASNIRGDAHSLPKPRTLQQSRGGSPHTAGAIDLYFRSTNPRASLRNPTGR